MRVFDMIVHERRRMADLLDGLPGEQLARPSLCEGWTVHDVAAHLTTFLRFGQAKLYLGIVATAADIDKVNRWLTRRAARRPTREHIAALRARAAARTTIPRSGYDPVLTDIVLHDLDIRRPLGIATATREEHLWVSFNHLTTKPSPGFTMGSRLRDLRLVADDTGWAAGDGPLVRGRAEDLLLGIGGRATAFDDLDGDGVPLLRARVTSSPQAGPARRLATIVRVVVRPPAADRRSRTAVGPAPGDRPRPAGARDERAAL
jgi:uncharacterized protein (TIGR03083 family)